MKNLLPAKMAMLLLACCTLFLPATTYALDYEPSETYFYPSENFPVHIEDLQNTCPCKVEANFLANFGIVDPCTLFFTEIAKTNECTNVSSWSWDFGDGTTSNSQNPAHTYSTDGTYTVCLTVVANNGTSLCSDTYCKTVTISGCAPPCECKLESDFSANYGIVDPCTLFFSENATTNSCTNITNWYWTFGDGTTSTQQNPAHTYSYDGTYTVCLTIEGNNGAKKCTDTYCKQITISGCAPPCPCKLESNFSANYGIVDPCTLFFNETATTNSCTNITNWTWDFGDGTTSSQQNPAHTFAGDGTYTVCLTVAGNNGLQRCVDTYCKKITIIGCTGGSGSSSKIGKGTNNEVIDVFDVSVYPNPFAASFSINFDNPADQNVEIELLDASGKLITILDRQFRNTGSQTLDIYTDDLNISEGVYLVSIKAGNSFTYKKVILEK